MGEIMTAAKQPGDDHVVQMPSADQMEVVEIRDLQIDREYQRQPNRMKVDAIACEYDLEAAGIITVNIRTYEPGRPTYVIDGQHRMLAARKANEPEMFAFVYRGLSVSREAWLFNRLNTNRGPVRALDRFRSALVAGDDKALAIKAVIEAAGAEIDFTHSSKGLRAIASVEKIYDKHGAKGLRDVLLFIKATWPDVGLERPAIEEKVLMGVAYLLANHRDKRSESHLALAHQTELDFKRMQNRLDAVGLRELTRQTINLGQVFQGAAWMNWYRAAITVYNRNLRVENRVEPVA
jgi:hypothetical protein